MIRQKPKEPYKGLKRTPLKRKPPKLKNKPLKSHSRQKMRIDPLDSLFSHYIRLRDNYTCQRCGKYSKLVQCAHFIGRIIKSVRWDEDNACTLCIECHNYVDTHKEEKKAFFKQLLGEEKYNSLLSRVNIFYHKTNKKGLTIYFKAKLKNLDKSP